MKKIKTICCQCGVLICDGPTLNGCVSHGYCIKCRDILLAQIKKDYSDDARNPV